MKPETDHESDAAAQSIKHKPPVEGDDSSEGSNPQFLDIRRISDTKLFDVNVSRLESQERWRIERQCATEITAQSDLLSARFDNSLNITASSTEELRTLQEAVAIKEETVREMQADAGLQCLYPARREEFITEVLQERIDVRTAERLDSEDIQMKAEEQIAALFDQEGSEVTLTWTQQTDGSFRDTNGADDPDLSATIHGATTDLSNTALRENAVDIVVVVDEYADVAIASPIANQSLTLERGCYIIHTRSIRAVADDAGLILVAVSS